MLDSVSNAALSTLLRAQNAGTSAGIVALKSNQQATQAIISQLQQTVDQNKPAKGVSSTALVTSSAMPSSSLPRGSLVDMLV